MTDKYLNVHYNITLDTLYYGRSKNLYLRVRRLKQISSGISFKNPNKKRKGLWPEIFFIGQ